MAPKSERTIREGALNKNAADQAHEMALAELRASGIDDPNTPAGREFMFRVGLFGIMGAQPPRPEFNAQSEIEVARHS